MADEVEHNPGPWWVTNSGVRNSGGYICNTNFVPRYQGQEERHEREVAARDADKLLIAAAPDLLEALQDLFGADMEHVLMGDGKDDQVAAIAKAHAAIAKATGAAALKGSAEHERQEGRFYDQ